MVERGSWIPPHIILKLRVELPRESLKGGVSEYKTLRSNLESNTHGQGGESWSEQREELSHDRGPVKVLGNVSTSPHLR